MRTPLTPNPKHYYFDNKILIPFHHYLYHSKELILTLPLPSHPPFQLNSTLFRKLSFEVRLCTEYKWNINSNIKNLLGGALELGTNTRKKNGGIPLECLPKYCNHVCGYLYIPHRKYILYRKRSKNEIV